MIKHLSLVFILVAACGGNSPKPESPDGEGVVQETKDTANKAKDDLDDAVEEAGDDIEDATDK